LRLPPALVVDAYVMPWWRSTARFFSPPLPEH